MDALPIGDRVIWAVSVVVALLTAGRMVSWWIPLVVLLIGGFYGAFAYQDRRRGEKEAAAARICRDCLKKGYGCLTDGLDDTQCRRWVAKHDS